MEFLLIPAFALLNCLRGRKLLAIRGEGNDWVFALLCGTAAGLAAWSAPIGIIVAAGMRLGEMSGWSFDEITGEFNPGKYHAWIERAGLFVFPKDGYRRTNRRRGVLMRTLRSSYYYPLFAGLAWLNPWAWLIGLGCLLQGLAYGFVGLFGEKEYSVAFAELLSGALIGAMIATVIHAGGA